MSHEALADVHARVLAVTDRDLRADLGELLAMQADALGLDVTDA